MKKLLLLTYLLMIGCAGNKPDDSSLLFLLLMSAASPGQEEAVQAARCAANSSGATYGGPDTGKVLISEIAFRFMLTANWIELHNGTLEPVNLSSYRLRVSETYHNANGYGGMRTYDLPSIIVEPGAYIIVRAAPSAQSSDSLTASLVDDDGYFPFWGTNGFIELLSDGVTVDFVRFGTNTTVPTTPSEWTGSNAPALADSFTTSLQRITSDSNQGSDWSLVVGITPFLPNSPDCAVDADQDGLPDCAEVDGRAYRGMSLYAMGARPYVRDMFVELDYMDQSSPECLTCPDAGLLPDEASLNKIKERFAAHGVAVHFDVGDLFDDNGITGDNPDRFDLCNKGYVPFHKAVRFDPVNPGESDPRDLKRLYMDSSRRLHFHYVFYSYSNNTAGSIPDYAGMGLVSGSVTIMAQAQRNLQAGSNENSNTHSAVLFHELGHNLGLHHGGNEQNNYKPNYLSSMNYRYNYNLPVIGQNEHFNFYYSVEECRNFYGAWNLYSNLHSHTGMPVDSYYFDFSNGSGNGIDESAISEAAGLGRPGGSPVDFNCNGVVDGGTYSLQLDDYLNVSVLEDWNDWGAITIFAAGSASTPWNASAPPEKLLTQSSRNPYHNRLTQLEKDPDFAFHGKRVGGLAMKRDGGLVAVPAGPGAYIWMDQEQSEFMLEAVE